MKIHTRIVLDWDCQILEDEFEEYDGPISCCGGSSGGGGSSGTVDQGVQHAYEIFTVGIKETALNISLTAFPNPTMDNLTLQISDYNNEKLSYQLFDMQGKQLSNGQIVAQQTQINMNSLPTATYFVNVVNQENKKVQSDKILYKGEFRWR